MAKVYAMIADGTEEVECLAVVDVLRRAGIETVLVSAMDRLDVVSSHNIRIQADAAVSEVDFSDADVIFLPGGMPGSEHLSGCAPLIRALEAQNAVGKRIAAICAAPAVVLGRHGFLRGKEAICFPGFEEELVGAVLSKSKVVTDGNITTAKGVGVALDLGLELVRLLKDWETAEDLKRKIQYA
ncbi:MAG: DJ-1/PfpI family protein [Eubacteriales bacterium]|nr:DJ-1/PfpI family protein [Eubacteriales bacterium]